MGKFIDVTGLKFGRLTVLERVDNYKTSARWKCICDCGNIRLVVARCLRSGHTKSCGCLNSEKLRESKKIHGYASRNQVGGHGETNEYNIWVGMNKRCYNKKTKIYKDYGGRGIEVCERWRHDFESFYKDMGDRPSKYHSIDRVDVNGNYEPSNCRWATRIEQARNTRVYKNSKFGVNGVSLHKKTNKYSVNIGTNKKIIHIGTYTTLEDAIQARKEAELKYWG